MQNYIFLSHEELYFINFHLFILKILIFGPYSRKYKIIYISLVREIIIYFIIFFYFEDINFRSINLTYNDDILIKFPTRNNMMIDRLCLFLANTYIY